MTKPTSLTEAPYFTIVPSGGGLTAHLLQFNSFYKLGLSLGYKYIHTTFKSRRSSNKIYSFLGFNQYFGNKTFAFKLRNLWWLRKRRFMDIAISDEWLKTNSVSTLQELQSLIQKKVANQTGNQALVVRFKTVGKRAFFHNLVQTQIPEFPDQLDLYSIYERTREKRHIRSRFTDNKIKLLVHIRQGDTAIIETPWHTYIPTQGPNQLTELRELDTGDRGCESIDVNDFYNFVKRLVNYFDKDHFSVVVSSDGYQRGFDLIYKNIHRFDFSSCQIQDLKKAQSLYEKKFEVFENIKDSVCIVGENDKNLFDLVHSSLTADVIVTGTQQRFVPKLLSSYYNLDNPPIIFVLRKREEAPNYEENLALSSQKATIIPVQLDDFDEELFAKAKHKILALKYK